MITCVTVESDNILEIEIIKAILNRRQPQGEFLQLGLCVLSQNPISLKSSVCEGRHAPLPWFPCFTPRLLSGGEEIPHACHDCVDPSGDSLYHPPPIVPHPPAQTPTRKRNGYRRELEHEGICLEVLPTKTVVLIPFALSPLPPSTHPGNNWCESRGHTHPPTSPFLWFPYLTSPT